MSHDYDPTDLDGNAKRAEQVKESEERAAALARSDLKWVAAHKEGRRFLRRILSQCGAYNSSYRHSHGAMCHAAGQRDIALWLEASLKATCIARWFEMEKEALTDD